MSINGTLQLFDESVNLTGGGPANSTLPMSHYIYKASFEYNPQFGYAATMSYVIFIMVAILSFVQMKTEKSGHTYYFDHCIGYFRVPIVLDDRRSDQ